MEAYVDEVRKLEEHFDGLQAEHVPRAQNWIADDMSKLAAQKMPVESGTFVLQLTRSYVTPSKLVKKRKQDVDGYFSAELPVAVKKADTIDKPPFASEQQHPASQILVVKASAPAEEEMPLVLVIEPQAPAWAQPIVQFL